MEKNRPSWTSRYAFILAAIGSAVGLGNIWRFPYIMGQNGGAIFLLVYLVIIATICFIPLVAELSLGKISKKECVGAYEHVSPELKPVGALNPITGVLIASFYFVVGGWIINYIYKSLIGFKIYNYSEYFSAFTQNSFANCALTFLFLFMCTFFTARGVKKGIEIANKVLMPMFAVILLFLVVVSLTLPNANVGLEYMFRPDFTKFNGHMFLAALGQAFFTLSIGMGALLTYGSYINDDKSITKSAYTIILADTLFALLAGIMIFPAVFAFNLEPDSGAGLVFITLPQIFAQIPFGNIVSAAFFVLLFIAALTSGISILEAPTATLIERFKMTRIKASIYLLFIVGIISIPASLSFGIMSDTNILGKTVFDFLDYTTSNILLPLNTLFLCLITGWGLKIKGEMFVENKFLARIFDFGLKFAVPVILVIMFHVGLGG